MNLNPVILAIPMYFTLMAIELVYESITNRKTYRLNDAITNINTGVLNQLTGTFFKIVKIGIYVIVYENFAFYHIPATWASFIAVFILWDLCYYWEHRMAHEISLFWGGHSVHHQSEDYNLSVALRQSSTAMFWGFPFFLPLALVGFDPIQFALVGGFNLLYQFWIHTEHIDRLPRWFEYIFNTPSHHRVHHGRDPKYIDKNYGGVFIIWDRMFGTFKQEEERPNYGITTPLNSWNPVYANFAHYIHLFGAVKQSRSAVDSLKILFNRPGWYPDYMGGVKKPHAVNAGYEKYNVSRATLWMNIYILVQFLAALGVIANYLFTYADMAPALQWPYASWIIITTIMFGFLFEVRSRWLSGLEILRLFTIPLSMVILAQSGYQIPGWALIASSIFAILSVIAFQLILRQADAEPKLEEIKEPVATLKQ